MDVLLQVLAGNRILQMPVLSVATVRVSSVFPQCSRSAALDAITLSPHLTSLITLTLSSQHLHPSLPCSPHYCPPSSLFTSFLPPQCVLRLASPSTFSGTCLPLASTEKTGTQGRKTSGLAVRLNNNRFSRPPVYPLVFGPRTCRYCG